MYLENIGKYHFVKGNWIAGFRDKVDGNEQRSTAVFQVYNFIIIFRLHMLVDLRGAGVVNALLDLRENRPKKSPFRRSIGASQVRVENRVFSTRRGDGSFQRRELLLSGQIIG